MPLILFFSLMNLFTQPEFPLMADLRIHSIVLHPPLPKILDCAGWKIQANVLQNLLPSLVVVLQPVQECKLSGVEWATLAGCWSVWFGLFPVQHRSRLAAARWFDCALVSCGKGVHRTPCLSLHRLNTSFFLWQHLPDCVRHAWAFVLYSVGVYWIGFILGMREDW